MNKNSNRHYYLVTVKCGHVGKNNYIPITFPTITKTASEAAMLIRNKGRVKHHQKDAILFVEETDYEGFLRQELINHHDPYLNARNIQEQNAIMHLIQNRIQPEVCEQQISTKKTAGKKMYQGKNEIRNPKKWAKLNYAI